MRFYKKQSELPRGYYADLYLYLKSRSNEFFSNKDNRAIDMRDFETWPNSPVDRDHLVLYGEIMLVDLEMPECDHAYVICEVTRGKHKLSSGRVVHLKPLQSIIPIVDINSSDWRNGYFLLPKI